MLGRRMIELVFLSSLISFVIGHFVQVNLEDFFSFAPSIEGISNALGGQAAFGFSLSALLSIFTAVIYGVINKSDNAAIEVMEWYGCFILGVFLAAGFYCLASIFWGVQFESIRSARKINWLYQESLQSIIWLYIVSSLIFSLGAFGIYIFIRGLLSTLKAKKSVPTQ